jgi:hypothetical protein
MAAHLSRTLLDAAGLLAFLAVYAVSLRRILGNNRSSLLVEWGFMTLSVFAAMQFLNRLVIVPVWLFGVWLVVVLFHCFATLSFLLQRVVRAVRQRRRAN